MNSLILLFQCADRCGIVARVSGFLAAQGCNIITADQHSTDHENGHFFLRVEFCLPESSSVEKLRDNFCSVADEFDAEWNMYERSKRLRMGVLVSHAGHCLVDILYLWSSGELKVDIPFVISNHETHRDIVEHYGIPFYHVPACSSDRREKEILELVKNDTDFLVLARYMQILSDSFLREYSNDIINIHHSFLPSFKGANPYRQAFDRGVKVIGATAHFVTADLDEGPIITQMVESVSHRDGVDDLVRTGKNLEKRSFSAAIHAYIDYKIIRYKNRTIVFF